MEKIFRPLASAFLAFTFVSAAVAFGADYKPLGIKPGLWTIESRITTEGKSFSPDAEMRKAFANLPPEQRKQMEAMLAKQGASLGKNGIQHCHSAEGLKDPKKLLQEKQDCTMDVKTSTEKKFAGAFTCKDGAKGDVVVDVKSDAHYEGKMNARSKDGKPTQVSYVAKFVSADCGKVKAN